MADTLGYLAREDRSVAEAVRLSPDHIGETAGVCRWRAGRATASGSLVLLLLALTTLLPAATPPQVVRFTVFAVNPLTDLAFVPGAGAAPQKLKFHPTARSPRYEYRGAMPLRFVSTDGQTVLAEASVPAGLTDALLLFSPVSAGAAGAGRLRYQVAVLDDGVARHGPGGLAIINLSGLALSGTINDRAVTLQSGLNPTLPVGRAAKVRLTTVFKQRTFQAYAGALTLRSDERALLILYPPFNAGSLEVQPRLLVDRPARK